MLLQMTQICFYDSDYIMLHPDMSTMTENRAKMTHKLLQYWFYTIIIWHLSEKCCLKDTMRDAVVWLSYCVYIFAILTYLTTVNQCLTMHFFQKICVIGKISVRSSKKRY